MRRRIFCLLISLTLVPVLSYGNKDSVSEADETKTVTPNSESQTELPSNFNIGFYKAQPAYLVIGQIDEDSRGIVAV